MDKGNLKSLGSALIPTTSAIVTVFGQVIVSKHKFDDGLKARKENVDEVVAMMTADITEKLKNENDCAYHLAITEDAVVFSQVTMSCFAADFKQIIITPDAATAKHVTVAPEGAAVEEVVVTGEVVAGAAAVITPETIEYEALDIEYGAQKCRRHQWNRARFMLANCVKVYRTILVRLPRSRS